VGVKVGVEVGVKVGEDVAVGGGDTVLGVGENSAAGACTKVALLTGRSVGGTAVGVGVAVGGKGVRVGGMDVAVVTLPSSPLPIGEGKEGAGACRSR
jgi:hypothetical protein